MSTDSEFLLDLPPSIYFVTLKPFHCHYQGISEAFICITELHKFLCSPVAWGWVKCKPRNFPLTFLNRHSSFAPRRFSLPYNVWLIKSSLVHLFSTDKFLLYNTKAYRNVAIQSKLEVVLKYSAIFCPMFVLQTSALGSCSLWESLFCAAAWTRPGHSLSQNLWLHASSHWQSLTSFTRGLGQQYHSQLLLNSCPLKTILSRN